MTSQEFAQHYDELSAKIYNFIYYRTQHQPTAQDLTSITFTKAWDKLATYSPEKGSFSSWVYRIARNTVTDYYRTHKPTQDIDTVFDLVDDTDIERDTDTAIQLAQVKAKLDILTPEQKNIVLMRLWDDLPYDEIARIMDKSEGSCKMAFSRAMRQLRQALAVVVLFVTAFLIS